MRARGGAQCIELMPVTEFGGAWGYNPRSCLAIHPAYGTPDDLRALVDRAAALGVAVVGDICLNHGAARLNALWNWDGYGPNECGGIYFDWGGGDTPWGKKFAFERAEVQVAAARRRRPQRAEGGTSGRVIPGSGAQAVRGHRRRVCVCAC